MALKLVFLACGEPVERLLKPVFLRELEKLGAVAVHAGAETWTAEQRLETWRGADVVLTGWGAVPLDRALATDPGNVRYVCHITGTLRGYIPREIIASPIRVTNWGDAPALGVAECTLTLLLACLKNLRQHIEERAAGEWQISSAETTGSLLGMKVGLFGMGTIARRVVEIVRPLGPVLGAYDPYVAEFPTGVERFESLETLCDWCEILSLHAGLTPKSRGSVRAEHFARLPDGGIVINTARGGLIDQEALFAEVQSGRLRAGLDVIDDDYLPPEHPARRWPNLILTGHTLDHMPWRTSERLLQMHAHALYNLQRFAAGERLRFEMTPERYDLST